MFYTHIFLKQRIKRNIKMQRFPGTVIVLENALNSLLYIKTKDYSIYVIEWGFHFTCGTRSYGGKVINNAFPEGEVMNYNHRPGMSSFYSWVSF